MPEGHGALVPADETLNHQIVDTFGTVGQSDPSWTEKVWTIAHARDGSLQLVFGIRKYTNRGVFDGAAGVARGTEQWTVRGSRTLAHDPGGLSVGPLRYEIVEPLRAVRCVLEANPHAAIAFDVTLRGAFAPSLEDPWPDRSADGFRLTHQVLRYHQMGVAEGWVEVEGHRTRVDPQSWIAFRDHSWGLRPMVGPPTLGLAPGVFPTRILLTWMPAVLERANGSRYALFAFRDHRVGDGFDVCRSQAEEQLDTGARGRFASVSQALEFRDDNRRLLGGVLTLHGRDGVARPLRISPVSTTGFHLGTAGYFAWNGRMPGEWVGDLVVDGEHVHDLDLPEVAQTVHHLRDVLVRVDDPVGGGSGLGNMENLVFGAFPEIGLTAENSFL